MLDKILNWHIENNWEIAESLQPGITREEIDEKVQDLPFPLPEEVYELYQWRNGMYKLGGFSDFSNFVFSNEFIPLEKAVEMSRNYAEEKGSRRWNPHWLLIFAEGTDNSDPLFVVIGEETAPIGVYGWNYSIRYNSLTEMIGEGWRYLQSDDI